MDVDGVCIFALAHDCIGARLDSCYDVLRPSLSRVPDQIYERTVSPTGNIVAASSWSYGCCLQKYKPN